MYNSASEYPFQRFIIRLTDLAQRATSKVWFGSLAVVWDFGQQVAGEGGKEAWLERQWDVKVHF